MSSILSELYWLFRVLIALTTPDIMPPPPTSL